MATISCSVSVSCTASLSPIRVRDEKKQTFYFFFFFFLERERSPHPPSLPFPSLSLLFPFPSHHSSFSSILCASLTYCVFILPSSFPLLLLFTLPFPSRPFPFPSVLILHIQTIRLLRSSIVVTRPSRTPPTPIGLPAASRSVETTTAQVRPIATER